MVVRRRAPVKKKKVSTPVKKPSSSVSASTPPQPQPEVYVKSESPPPAEIPEPVAAPAPAKPAAPSYPCSVSEPATLYVWDLNLETYVDDNAVTAQVVHRPEDPEFLFCIALINSSDGSLRLLNAISSDMNQRFSQKMNSFTWNYPDEQGGINSFCIRFEDDQALMRFVNAFARAGWETLHQSSFGKVKEDEAAYVMSSNTEDVEMADPEDDEDDEADVLHELDPENG
jgi:hypothetical protein